MSRGSLPPLEDDFSRALLGSAEADGPSSAAYAKAAAALGIGLGLGVGASLPAPAVVAAGAAGAAGIARWSGWLSAKLVALGVSGALLVGTGALLLRSSPPPARPAVPSGQARGAHATQAGSEPARPALASPSTERDRSASPLVAPAVPVAPVVANSAAANSTERAAPSSAVRPLTVPPATRRTAPARVSIGSSLAEQVQSLDRARVALGSGDSSAALREIAHYRAAWPTGVFLTEASVLEIEALAARGERTQARARAADFVAAHPDSPQADRLRALVPAQKR